MMAGMASTMMQGLAFGTGSAIAHRAVGAVAGAMSGDEAAPAAAAPQQQYSADQRPAPAFASNGGGDACAMDKANFFECLKANQGDVNSCQFLADAMKACQNGGNKGW